jgi:hypothetical protein
MLAVTGEWRKRHNEELRDLYCSPSIIRIIKSRRMRWAGHVARMGKKRNAYRLLVGKQKGKRALGRRRRRWVDNIGMDLGEVGWADVDWIDLAQDRNRWRALVNSVEKNVINTFYRLLRPVFDCVLNISYKHPYRNFFGYAFRLFRTIDCSVVFRNRPAT